METSNKKWSWFDVHYSFIISIPLVGLLTILLNLSFLHSIIALGFIFINNLISEIEKEKIIANNKTETENINKELKELKELLKK